MRTRAQRRHNTRRAINRQLSIIKGSWWTDIEQKLAEPGRYAKHNVMNCGNPNCTMCGNPRKVWNEKTMQELKAEESEKDWDFCENI